MKEKGENLTQINCSVVLVLWQMTSNNTGLIEISDGAQRLPQRQKETAGRYNPATLTLWEREDAQPNKSTNSLASAANGSKRCCHSRGTCPRRSRGSRQGALPERQHQPSGRWPANAVLAPRSHVPRPALGAHWHGTG